MKKLNYRRRLRTLRTLDFENTDAKTRTEGRSDSGRLSDSLYEGATRNPHLLKTTEQIEERHSHRPVEGEKPDPRAQWDDVEGCWIIWNLETNQWDQIPTQ